MTDQLQKTKYGVYDPATKLFVSSAESVFPYGVQWTDKVDDIRLFVQGENALEWLKWAQMGVNRGTPVPTAILVEVNVTLTWAPCSLTVNQTPTFQKRYQKYRQTYDELLPAYMADVEAMSKKDWQRFKVARRFLRELGEPVEK